MVELPSYGEFDTLTPAEPTGTPVVRKSKLSEDEIRLGEEAFLNALVELEALGNTAAEAKNERAEKERQVQSEIDALRRTEEQGIEEAHDWSFSSQEQLEEEQTEVLSADPSASAEAEYEPAEEEEHPHSDDSSTLLAESFTSETNFSDVPSQTPLMGGDLQQDELLVAVTEPLAETKTSSSSQDLDLPAEVIHRINSDSSSEFCVALSDLARLGGENAFRIISLAFDEQSEEVRNAAAQALFDLQPDRAPSFARTLREASPERRRRVGSALATSGLADIAIGNLAGQTREQGYEAFSLLFLMTKAGEFEPLLRSLEDHSSIEVRLTVVKLLALNGQAEIVPSLRRLAVSGVLPSEVRAALIEAIYELGRQMPRQLSLGAKVIENQINL